MYKKTIKKKKQERKPFSLRNYITSLVIFTNFSHHPFLLG